MGKKQIPVLVEQILGLVDGSAVEVDTAEWQQWLDNPENRSFRFDDLAEGYTCRKEKVRGQDGYWYAYRSVLGKTRSKYVGKSDSLTYEKLKAVDFEALPKIPKQLPSSVGNTANDSVGNTSDDVRAMIETINERLEALEKRLGKRDSLEVDEASTQLPNTLPTRLDNALPSSVGNAKLQEECNRLRAENDSLRQQIIEEREKSWKESGELVERCNKFQMENETLKQRLEDESHMRLRGEIRELEERLQAKNQKMIAQREEASKEIKNLTEQRDKFQRLAEQMGRELKALRESLPDNDDERSLPDVAKLLNIIRQQNPKLKITLRDVEAILVAIGELTS